VPYAVRELLWVVASAAQLLLHGPLERVGECPSCRWLFRTYPPAVTTIMEAWSVD
jgi:predicted RNA-binding Zn ribbon-like protein